MCCAAIGHEPMYRWLSHVVPGFLYLLVGKSNFFVKTVNSFSTLDVNVEALQNVHQIVLVNDFLRDQINGGADILVIFGSSNGVPR